jgi:integrase
MPRRNAKVPAYLLHKPSGLARVIVGGKHIYLGKHGSPESLEKYARIVTQLSASRSQLTTASPETPRNGDVSVNELLLEYFEFARNYYARNGVLTKEFSGLKEALLPVRQLFGLTKARDFGPRALKAVQQHFVDQGICRNLVNRRVSRIKRVFKWATSEELIPGSVYHSLQSVSGLRFGRTEARETEPVKPVPDLHVAAVLPFVSPQVAAMIKLQRITGMRPGEVVRMRPCDISLSEDPSVAIYEPVEHKTKWRGHRKLIALGPEAQEILEPFMNREATASLFCPRESEAWRLARRPVQFKQQRKTPIYPSELRAREKAKLARRRRRPKRPKRDRYDVETYRRAIEYGLRQARKHGIIIPHWHPNQLRHTRATEIRRLYGIEAAQVALGHANADVTQVYAEKNLSQSIQIARKLG